MREHAGFIALVGGAPLVIAGVLVPVGLAESSRQQHGLHLWSNTWFVVGVVSVVAGLLIEAIAAGLYLRRSGLVRSLSDVLKVTPVLDAEHSGYSQQPLGLRLGYKCKNLTMAQIASCKVQLIGIERQSDDGSFAAAADGEFPLLPVFLFWRPPAVKVDIPADGERMFDIALKDAVSGKFAYLNDRLKIPFWGVPDGVWRASVSIQADNYRPLEVKVVFEWASALLGSASGVLRFIDETSADF